MKNKLLALLLSLTLLLSLLSTTASAATTFKDDTGTGTWKWASTYIYACQEAGIISGYDNGTFQPDSYLTRAQAATIIAQAFSLTKGSTSVSFSDVSKSSWYYKYVNLCASNGIIVGYTDGTFKPDNYVSRSEFCVMIANAMGLENTGSACFLDDDGTGHWKWASTYIYACYDAGLISGYDDGGFYPADTITRAQAAVIISKAAGCVAVSSATKGQLAALEAAKSYLTQYYISFTDMVQLLKEDGYTTSQATYAAINCGANWKEQAMNTALYLLVDLPTQGYYPTYNNVKSLLEDSGFTASQVTYALKKAGLTDQSTDENQIKVAGTTYTLGMSASQLPTPDETLSSVYGFTWYVYGTTDYTDFFVAGVKNNTVVTLITAGVGMGYQGLSCGDWVTTSVVNESYHIYVATDSNDNYITHAVWISTGSFYSITDTSATALAGESKLVFHLTNALRVFHGLSPLTWCSSAATAAQLHSVDMATNNYFDHTGLDGSTSSTRLSAQGVTWWSAGENICVGYVSAFDAYNGWVNSAGHRSNMLGSFYTHLGVGSACKSSSSFGIYWTQVFYS